MITFDPAAVFVEADARGLLGIKRHGLEAKTLLKEAGAFDGLMANLLIVRNVELDANATVLCIDEKSKVVSRGSAPQRASVILRGFLRIERPHKLRRAQSDLAVLRPVRQLCLLRLRQALAHLDGLCPLVGLFHDVELGRRERISDGPQLDLDQKEAKVVVRMLVKPLDGLTMLVSRMSNDPNNHFGALAGGVSDDLAQMIVVGVLELVKVALLHGAPFEDGAFTKAPSVNLVITW